MKPVLTILLLSVLTTLSAQNWGWGGRSVKGNGDLITEQRDLRGFNGVSTSAGINVELRQGDFDVKVEAESNIMEYVRTDVSGGRLEIDFQGGKSIDTKRPVTIYVSLPELGYTSASSSGKITGGTPFRGDELEADVNSGGRIKLDFEGNRLNAEASSGGSIVITGQGKRVRANASSGGKVSTGDFAAKEARCDASSGGGITVKVSEELNAEASSGGRVRYVGNPGYVNADTSSGGSVTKK